MTNKIEIDNNTLLRLQVRSGTNSERLLATLSPGELGYTTDHKRLWIGDGTTAGGNIVGNINVGNITITNGNVTITNGTAAQVGDVGYNSATNTTYRLDNITQVGVIAGWTKIAEVVATDNTSIELNSNNKLAIKAVDSSKILWTNPPTNGISYNTTNDNFSLNSTINVNKIDLQAGASELELPNKIKGGSISYTLPTSTPGEGHVLHSKIDGTTYWSAPTSSASSLQLSSAIMNAGAIMLHVGTPPSGWILADGSALSRTTYADLFASIGVVFGNGDGTTTFNIPNYTDKVPVGVSNISTGSPTELKGGSLGSDRAVKGRYLIKTTNDNVTSFGTNISVGSGITLQDTTLNSSVSNIDITKPHEIRLDVGTLASPNTSAIEAVNKSRSNGSHTFTWKRMIDSTNTISDFQTAVNNTLGQINEFIIPANVYQIKVTATGGGGDSSKGGAAGGTWIGYIKVEPGYKVSTTVGNYKDSESASAVVDGTWDRYRMTGGDTIVTVQNGSTIVAQIRAQGGQPGSGTTVSSVVDGQENVSVIGTGQGGKPIENVTTNISSSTIILGGCVAGNNTVTATSPVMSGPSSFWGGPGAFGAGPYLSHGSNSQNISLRGTGGVTLIEY